MSPCRRDSVKVTTYSVLRGNTPFWYDGGRFDSDRTGAAGRVSLSKRAETISADKKRV